MSKSRPGPLSRSLPLLLFVVLQQPGASRAAPLDEREPFALSAAELLALPSPNSPRNLDVEVLLLQADYSLDADGKLRSRFRNVYRILTQRGAEAWATTSMAYAPWHENKPTIRARVVNRDGTVHELQPATLVDSAASSQQGDVFSDARRLSGPLPAVRPGSVVEEVIERTEHRSYFEAGRVLTYAVSPDAYTQLTRVTYSAPTSVPLRYRLRGAHAKPQRSRSGDRQQLVFTFRDQLPVAEWPPASHPDLAMVPIIQVSTGRRWSDVADHYARIVDGQIGSFDATTLGASLTQEGDSRQVKLEKLLRYVHAQVRYTGLELGAHTLVPFTPQQTLERRYGDCKDKATLLVSLLRSQGIDAHVALLYTGPGLDVPQQLPGLGLFDHAIVHVPGTPSLWIDATADRAALGVIPTADQDRLALVARVGTKELVRIPRMAASESVYAEDVHIELVDGGKAKIREVTTVTGALSPASRSAFEGTEARLVDRFARYVEERYDARLDRADSSFTVDVSQPVQLTLDASESERFESGDAGGTSYLSANGLYRYLPELLYEDEEKEERRKEREKKKSDEKDPRYRHLGSFPVYVTSHSYVIRYHLSLPPGFEWQTPPATLELEQAGIRVWRTARADGTSRILVEMGLAADQRLVDPKELRAVQQMLTRYDEQSSVELHYAFGPDARLERGEVVEGLAAYRALLARTPGDLRLRARYAKALSALGFGHEAHTIAERLVAQRPGDPHLQWTLGFLSLFDAMGRDTWPEADLKKASEAAQKAVDLDPDRRGYRSSLDAILQIDEDHEQFLLSSRRRTQVLESLRAERERFDDESLDQPIVQNLMWLGRHGEALELLRRMKDSEHRTPLWVAALGAVEGAAPAARKAQELAGGDGSAVLLAAASALAIMGDTRAASVLGRHPVLASNPKAAAINQLFDHLLRRSECLEAMAPAARAVHDYVYSFASRTDGDARIAALERAPFPAHYDVESLQRELRRYRRGEGNESRSLTARSLACALAWDVEEHGTAIRVRLHFRGTPATNKTSDTWYVLRKGKGHEVVGAQAGGRLVTLARLALLALRGHDLGAARAYLGWLDELQRETTLARDEYSIVEGYRTLKPASLRDADAETLWRLAAVVSSADAMGKPEETVLVRALREVRDAPSRTALRYALAKALVAQFRYAAAADLLAELHAERPADAALWRLWTLGLDHAGRSGEALKELAAYEASHPGSEAFLDPMRRRNRAANGEFAQLLAESLERKRAGRAQAAELNDVAWFTLVYGGDLRAAAELVEESLRLSRRRETLHTAATVYAELGEVDKAHHYLKEFIAGGSQGADDTAAWYTLARIAEQLKLDQSARYAYGRMLKPKYVSPTGVWSLHERARKSGAGAPR